jgi:lipoate-protein ligase A
METAAVAIGESPSSPTMLLDPGYVRPVRTLHLLRDAVPGRPALDAALSRALLEQVATGAAPETFRLYRPDDVLAFSGIDAASPGFRDACVAARAQGFAPVLRLAGGRAAVFTPETLAFAWAVRAPELRAGIAERFEELASLIARALARLGIDARVGEVPGEYCPGAHSVNARGRRKLVGVGQRVIRGAAHVGGVIVVGGSERLRAVLVPVYGALGLRFDPDTAGSISDEVSRGVGSREVAEALLAELRAWRMVEDPPPSLWETALAQAATHEARFRIPGPGEDPAARTPRISW